MEEAVEPWVFPRVLDVLEGLLCVALLRSLPSMSLLFRLLPLHILRHRDEHARRSSKGQQAHLDTLRSRETDFRLGNSWQAPASAQIQCQSIGDRNDIYLALTEKTGLKICQQTDDRQDQEQEPERRGKSGQQTAHIHLCVMTLDLTTCSPVHIFVVSCSARQSRA